VERSYYRVKPYREKMDEAGIKPEHIKSLADLQKLPFTTKDFLRDNYPFGLFTVPLEQVVRVHASSGTTGKPTVVGYTKRDIETWAEVMARALACGGVHRGDVVHNAEIASRVGEVRAVNIVMVGVLSTYLPIDEQVYVDVMNERIPERFRDVNIKAFQEGRKLAVQTGQGDRHDLERGI